MDLAGRVAIVTGGAAGCGEAICRRFAGVGASVVVVDVDADGARRVAREIGGVAIPGDVGAEADNVAAVEGALERYGRIDVFVANAGIMWGSEVGTKEERGGIFASDDDWQRVYAVNQMANVYAARAVIPHWLQRGEGYFVVNASAAGLLTSLGNAPYAVSKHAAVGFTEWLAIAYGDAGIRVFVLDGALLAPHGRLPFNTDGGSLCNNHPQNRGGMTKIIEAVRQLRGEAHPAVQVPDCRLALAHGTGGWLSTRMGNATVILGREDA